MSKPLSSLVCAAAILTAGAVGISVPAATAATSFRIGFDYFQDKLSPYGRWVHHPIWGDVWRPNPRLAGRDFQPYVNGYWEYTDEYGWYWVSEDPFDDVVYHYGRWVYDPRWHWLWVPGYTWSPAWVLWREGDDYTGWMPMPPDDAFVSGSGLVAGVNIGPAGLDFYRNWYGGEVDPTQFLVFVDNRHLVDRDYRRFKVPRDRVGRIVSRTREIARFEVVNNRVINRGIDLRIIERAAGHRIAPLPARTVIKPGAAITTVDEARQIREHERAAHPMALDSLPRRPDHMEGDRSIGRENKEPGNPGADRKQPSSSEGDGGRRESTGEDQSGKNRGRDVDNGGGADSSKAETQKRTRTHEEGRSDNQSDSTAEKRPRVDNNRTEPKQNPAAKSNGSNPAPDIGNDDNARTGSTARAGQSVNPRPRSDGNRASSEQGGSADPKKVEEPEKRSGDHPKKDKKKQPEDVQPSPTPD